MTGKSAMRLTKSIAAMDMPDAHARLLLPVAKAHGMTKLLITNNDTNIASRRVCEKLHARFLRVARLPEWEELYQRGQRFINIFEWSVE